MKARFLFPHKWRYVGYLLAIPGFILGFFEHYFQYELSWLQLTLTHKTLLFEGLTENYTNELSLTMLIVGLLFIAFSKLKREDELTAKIRLDALYWAILINGILLSAGTLFDVFLWFSNFHGFWIFSFGWELIAYNMFVPLVIFVCRFYYLLYSNKNEFTVKPTRYLSNKPFRFIGKWLSIIFILAIIVSNISRPKFEFLEVAGWVLPVSLLLWVYSKEKTEDEFIKAIRLEAMQMAVYVNYGILLICNFIFYDTAFLSVEYYNTLTIPLIFIGWFQYRLFQLNKPNNLKATLI